MIEKKLRGLINANCWAHARRDYADAIKIADKSNPDAVRRSVAYQALSRISQIYKLEGALKDLTAGERLKERQNSIKPLVAEYFAWVKSQLKKTAVPPKGKTAEGLKYSLNQEKYLKVFLTDGKVYPLIIQQVNVPSELSVSVKRTGCFTIPFRERRQALSSTVFRKPQSSIT